MKGGIARLESLGHFERIETLRTRALSLARRCLRLERGRAAMGDAVTGASWAPIFSCTDCASEGLAKLACGGQVEAAVISHNRDLRCHAGAARIRASARYPNADCDARVAHVQAKSMRRSMMAPLLRVVRLARFAAAPRRPGSWVSGQRRDLAGARIQSVACLSACLMQLLARVVVEC
jgi:hypothetical protein